MASSNKFRYYEVTQTTVVKANNAGDAAALASGKRGVPGQILGSHGYTERVSAADAQWVTAEVSS